MIRKNEKEGWENRMKNNDKEKGWEKNNKEADEKE